MNKAIEVVIREPRVGWADLVTRLISGLVTSFLFAWFLMMLAPMVFGVEVEYWQALGFMVMARMVWPQQTFPYLKMSEKQKVSK